MSQRFVGQAMKRKEDPRLVSGTSTYVDDVVIPGMLHMAVARSIHAHARLKRVDISKAQKLPGVIAIVTGEEVAANCGPVPCAAEMPDLKPARKQLLAVGKVRFVGEPIAAVVATDKYIAKDAVDLIEVDYEPLPAVVNPEKAMEPSSTRLYDEFSDNIAFRSGFETNNTEEAFNKADVIVKERFINQRLAPIAMEPRGTVANFQMPDNELVVWSSTQVPHLLRTQIALMVRIPENKTRVIAPEVGGAFGSKCDIYSEDGLVVYLAQKTGRPVKWIESRRENIAATIHGRDQINDVELALKNDGTILGLRVKVIADLGAYFQLLTPMIPTLTGLLAPGCYKIPAYKFDVIGVLTNKMATDAYRGAGRPEATYLIERIVDVAAQKLKMDPAEIRMKNFPQPEEFPYKTSGGVIYDSANYQAALNLALERADYRGLRQKQAELRRQGKYMGIGLSSYVEICAVGPSVAMPAGGWESATVRIEPTGQVTVLTGSSPHGQGQETTFAQIIADELGLTPNDVAVIHGDTGRIPYGIGTFGSRATAVGGTAMLLAVRDLKEKLKKISAHLLETTPDKIEVGAGKFSVAGEPARFLKYSDAVSVAYMARRLPPGVEPGLDATRFFEPSNFTFPFGTHVCVVEIDEETGDPKITKYVAVDDCGNVINPLLVEGQVHGGLVQGIGQALHEEVVYDENGQLITGSLMDYAVPRAHDFPEFELDRTVTPSPVNPLGVKGVGEAGAIGSTPAVVNAIVDALSPFGITHIDMPVRSEKIWKILKGEKGIMIAQNFEYIVPTSLGDAVNLLQKHAGRAKIVAGGHSLIPMMKLRLAAPEFLIDIGRIPELSYVKEDENKIRIGALTTHHAIETSAVIRHRLGALADAAGLIGDIQVRNKGTIGGSIAHADPAADYPAAILAFDATIVTLGPQGERQLPASRFFVDMMTTALEQNEIVREIQIPVKSGRIGSAYLKMAQKASGFAICGVAAFVELSAPGGAFSNIALGITGVGSRAFRASKAEASLKGQTPSPEIIRTACEKASDGIMALEDIHASADYRLDLARIYARRAVQAAIERAG